MFSKIFDFFAQDEFAVAEPKESVAVNPELEIFNTITSAHDALLASHKKALESMNTDHITKPTIDKSKIQLLKKLRDMGFENQPEVVQMEKEIREYEAGMSLYRERLAKNRSYIDLLKGYQQKYPNNKFIDEDTLKQLNKKFGLVTAPVKYYNAEIPDKNKKEIIDFNCAVEDKRVYTRFIARSTSEVAMSIAFPHLEFNSRMWEYEVSFHKFVNYNDVKTRDSASISGLKGHYSLNINHQIYFNSNTGLTDAFILAPAHKFKDIPQNALDEGIFTSMYSKTEIKDPVVLQPVVGGFLIVSHWGFESTLPEVAGEPEVGIHNNSN